MQKSKKRLFSWLQRDSCAFAQHGKSTGDWFHNKGGDEVCLEPAKKRYNERTAVERTNLDLKDNHSTGNIRVKGNSKVFVPLSDVWNYWHNGETDV